MARGDPRAGHERPSRPNVSGVKPHRHRVQLYFRGMVTPFVGQVGRRPRPQLKFIQSDVWSRICEIAAAHIRLSTLLMRSDHFPLPTSNEVEKVKIERCVGRVKQIMLVAALKEIKGAHILVPGTNHSAVAVSQNTRPQPHDWRGEHSPVLALVNIWF